jgi:hypothetical protein
MMYFIISINRTRNKRRVITPDDINSLFSSSPNNKDKNNQQINESLRAGGSSSSRVMSLDGEGFDEVGNEEASDKRTIFGLLSLFTGSTNNDDSSNWLDDAVKDLKKEKAMSKKGRKAKGLTDDWRFWAGILATAAFASAFYTIYQQTGGNFGGESFSPSAIVGGSELVI